MQNKQENTERKILTIGEAKYFLDSVTEEGKGLIDTINIIVSEQERLKIQMGITSVAYDTMLEKLNLESANFEKAE